MEDKNRLIPTAIQNGLLLGLIGAIFTILMAFLSGDPRDPNITSSLLNGFLGLVLLAINILIAVRAGKSFREANNGVLTLGQGFLLVFLIFVIASILTSVASYIYYAFLAPDSLLEAYQELGEQMEEQLEDAPSWISGFATAQFDKILNPERLLLSFLSPGLLVFRALVAIVIAAILKRDELSSIEV